MFSNQLVSNVTLQNRRRYSSRSISIPEVQTEAERMNRRRNGSERSEHRFLVNTLGGGGGSDGIGQNISHRVVNREQHLSASNDCNNLHTI